MENKINWDQIENLFYEKPKGILIPDLWINIGGTKGPWEPKSNQIPDFFSIHKANVEIFKDIYELIPQLAGLHTFRGISNVGDVPGVPSIPEDYLAAYMKFKEIEPIKLNMKMIKLI